MTSPDRISDNKMMTAGWLALLAVLAGCAVLALTENALLMAVAFIVGAMVLVAVGIRLLIDADRLAGDWGVVLVLLAGAALACWFLGGWGIGLCAAVVAIFAFGHWADKQLGR